MSFSAEQIELILIYFVYGLAFFSMGLAALLEAGRHSPIAGAQVLRPLAAFGLIHGVHEWLEIYLYQGEWLGAQFPLYLSVVRLALLVFSFAALLAYTVQMMKPARLAKIGDLGVVGLSVALYTGALILLGETPWEEPTAWVRHADILARYMLAVPGALLAAMALRRGAKQVQSEDRGRIARGLRLASWGLLIYGLSQIFVPRDTFLFSAVLNAELVQDVLGFPVQLLRAAMAVAVIIGVIRSMQLADEKRAEQLLLTQQARLDALEQVRKELVERERLRRDLLRRTVRAQEEERSRIARELHDEAAQKLTAFRINTSALKNRLPDQAEVNELVERLLSLSDQMARDIYRLMNDLRPAQLDDLGLVAALRYLAGEYERNFGLAVDVQIDGERCRLDPILETVFYRVAQEALTNVVRHAGVDAAELKLDFGARQISMGVCDKGMGFDVDVAYEPPHGLGLAGMRERVEAVQGSFEVHSLPGEGTRIRVVVPIQTTESVYTGA